jgi:predicted DCC family thiol-disulfide oxidoreductase YuxK
MQTLHVLYDADCELCRRLRVWLGQQAAFVPLTFIPLQSPDLETRFPGVTNLRPETELVVIGDAGEVWHGGHAWVTVLWALREYREWAQRLAHPSLIPLARHACALVSGNRQAISRWLSTASVGQLWERLAASADEAQTNEGYRNAR